MSVPFGTASMSRFSPDGTLLAVGGVVHAADAKGSRSQSIRVRVWEVPTGRVVGEMEWDVVAGLFAWSPDSRRLAVQRPNGEMMIWEPRTDGRVSWLAAGAPLFSPDGSRVAISGKAAVSIFKTATGDRIAERPGFATAMSFVESGGLVIQQGSAQLIWNPESGEEKGLGSASEKVLATSADGHVVAVEMQDGVSLRDSLTRAEHARFVLPGVATSDFHLSRDGGCLLFHDPREFGRLRVWDAATGKFLPGTHEPGSHLTAHFLGLDVDGGWRGNIEPVAEAPWPSSSHFSSDGAWVAVEGGIGEQQVFVCDVATGERVAALKRASRPEWSADGRWLAASGEGNLQLGGGAGIGGQMMVEVWEVARNVTEQRLPNPVYDIHWRADSRRLAVGRTLWDVETRVGRTVLHNAPQERNVEALRFLPNGEVWAIESHIPWNQPMRFFELSPGNRTVEIPNRGYLCAPAFSPDGKTVLVSTSANTPANAAPASGQFELWSLSEGKSLTTWPVKYIDRHNSRSTVFSPDGKFVASGEFLDQGIEIREVATGVQLKHLHRPERNSELRITFDRIGSLFGRPIPTYFAEWNVFRIAFSPDSRFVISCADNHALIRDVATGQELADCHAGPWTNSFVSLAISADGRTIATGDQGRMIRLWEIPTGRELAGWEAHAAPVTSLAFSPDGKTLASGGRDGALRLWNLPAIRRELGKMGLDW